jgi:hypothetical protein
MGQQICLNGSEIVQRFKILPCAADSFIHDSSSGYPRPVILPIQSEKSLLLLIPDEC